MSHPARFTGTGTRNYVCERCGREERLPYARLGVEKGCGACGAPCYCDPFPAPELMRRLAVMVARLEAEDGPLRVER